MPKHSLSFFSALSRKTIIILFVLFVGGAGAYYYNAYRNKPVSTRLARLHGRIPFDAL